jgi:GH24 family phage-related lysozyme (muramidase)
MYEDNYRQLKRTLNSRNNAPEIKIPTVEAKGLMSAEARRRSSAQALENFNVGYGITAWDYFANENAKYTKVASSEPTVVKRPDNFTNPYGLGAAADRIENTMKGSKDSKSFRDMRMKQTDESLEDFSVNFLKEREGYQATGKWDVTAFRAGHGSDTTTKADGTVVKVTEGMVVSEEDALRDLKRREAKFRARAKKQSGKIWDSYGDATKAALTSYTYNYGSLTDTLVKAVRSGDKRRVVAEIRARGEDNDGVNRNRRDAEASLVESEYNANEYKAAMDERNK